MEGDGSNNGGGSKAGKMDEQWVQAQAERKEREEREKARAESEKVVFYIFLMIDRRVFGMLESTSTS